VADWLKQKKTNSKKKVGSMKRVYFPAFHCSIYIYVGDDLTKYEKAYSTKFDKECFGESNGNGIYINTDVSCKQKCLEQTIVHECSHAIDWIFNERLRMKNTSIDITEIRAYSLDYLFNECIKYCRKKTNNKQEDK
jgi:hypothetical protein